MQNESRKFLFDLLRTPSPSGFEQPVQRMVKKRMKAFADEIKTDVQGNVILLLNPQKKPRIMLAGHVDQIGFMVRYIAKEGFVSFSPIGGIDASVVPGLGLTVHTEKGPLDGVVGRKAIHLMTPEERANGKVDIKKLWLDIGAKDKKQAEKMVNIGDPITYRLEVTRLGDKLVAAPGMDDKVGAFVVLEAFRQLAAKKKQLPCAVYAVTTVQEELGLRGARTSCFGIDPQVGIAVDVTHASDFPLADKKQIGDISLGKGPVIAVGPNINPVLGRLLMDTAKKNKMAYQREPAPGATGTDANAIQITRAGVASGLVSIPNRYMHTPVEVVHLKDVEAAANLLSQTCLAISPRMNFIPN